MLLGLRTTVAGVIAFVLSRVFALPSTYWAVLAAVVVAQSSVTSSFKESLEQFMATLTGAAWAILVSSFSTRNGMSEVLSLTAVLAPLSLLAAVKPRYKAAPATATIVLLSSVGYHGSTIEIGLKRVLDISVGCAVGFAVSLFALPSHTHRQLDLTIADALDLIAGTIAQIATGAAPEVINHRTRKAFRNIDAIADEAKREKEGYHTDEPDPALLIATLRALVDDEGAIVRASMQHVPARVIDQLSEPRAHAFNAVESFLRATASALSDSVTAPSTDAFETALIEYADAIERIRHDGPAENLSADEVGRLFGTGLAVTQLRSDLETLAGETRSYLNKRRH
ncbi:MAG: FUSC family protein [Candidatus Eremiobacteraeota bacterium]|nr:FUSC family protein [Candidatus Eremiobacteraeota bacterium]